MLKFIVSIAALIIAFIIIANAPISLVVLAVLVLWFINRKHKK